MKRLFFAGLAFIFIFSACKKEAGYEIKGNIDGLNNSYVYLKKVENNQWVAIDSVKAEAGAFNFEGQLKAPERLALSMGENKSLQFFAENSEINIIGQLDSLDNAKIEGSSIQKEYEKFQKQLAQYDDEMNKLYSKYKDLSKEGEEERMKEVEEQYMAVSDNRQEFVKKFVNDRTSSVLSPYVATQQLMPYMDYQELDSLYSGYDPVVKESKYAKLIKERKDVLERVQVGKPYIDFTLPDTTGDPLKFSNYIGDGYVLLDFWAAWCNPCRKENPNLVKNYKKYKDEGFEIVGVSLDRNEKAWEKAIEKDNITWPQASDLKGWDNPTRKEYGVMAIPSNFLINKEGKIVSKNLRGEELEDKLEEIYGNN